MLSMKRKLEIAVISDLHLATYACKAKNITQYLKSINPGILVLNGDIIDSWRFSRNYFPKSHLKVVRQLIRMMEKGIQIYYITGNHDEFLRRFNQTQTGNLKIVNQLILDQVGGKTWIFHGDVFDNIIHRAKWLAKIGAAGYGFISALNKVINAFLWIFGKKEIILYRSIKERFLKDSDHLSGFENMVAERAGMLGYKTVICGHTHTPGDKKVNVNNRDVRYLNCGDWVEHFTAAEYENGQWNLFRFSEEDKEEAEETDIPDNKSIYKSLINELAFPNLNIIN